MKPKPSKRIEEIFYLMTKDISELRWLYYSQAIIQYLDEQWEAQNKDKQ